MPGFIDYLILEALGKLDWNEECSGCVYDGNCTETPDDTCRERMIENLLRERTLDHVTNAIMDTEF